MYSCFSYFSLFFLVHGEYSIEPLWLLLLHFPSFPYPISSSISFPSVVQGSLDLTHFYPKLKSSLGKQKLRASSSRTASCLGGSLHLAFVTWLDYIICNRLWLTDNYLEIYYTYPKPLTQACLPYEYGFFPEKNFDVLQSIHLVH